MCSILASCSESMTLLNTSSLMVDDTMFRPEALKAVELRHILRTLEFTGGNKSRAANILGISRQTLREKVKQGEQVECKAAAVGAGS